MHIEHFDHAHANLNALLDKVVAERLPIKIERQHDQEGVVLIAAREWASIEETLYLLESPANARRLYEAMAELDAGKGEPQILAGSSD